jgi:hypothetical protein
MLSFWKMCCSSAVVEKKEQPITLNGKDGVDSPSNDQFDADSSVPKEKSDELAAPSATASFVGD